MHITDQFYRLFSRQNRTALFSNGVNSQGCDPRCDCDEVAKGCPGPRHCMKPDPDNCNTFIQCNDGGLLYVMPCAVDLEWNDKGLTCERPGNSTCHPPALNVDLGVDL
ncbi:hypothetical protein PPL_04012 [Heterostelium album PN500]|uniref:Chitin-binding type-2 domain-containing protein n=1 Tax=Heterostelium pallidum (strain ATCC 26659 / Pp 5 / PN500) TaxID=670386 RepID=D3B5S4_HETP5|nr:hypothetical protein PPL_04012 [Heterostelium album PN500]EFA83222.1 hypothetical protein PPL_04012 [Heterostelium album PN500]|eukprot:XP_020435339.1 hypothetical protein PPL_04012 [Heterostelium album PN500]